MYERKYILCTQCTQFYYRGQRGGGYGVCRIIFLVFNIFHIQKGVQVIIGLKFNIRKISRVTMLNHIIFYKKDLVIIYKSCLKRLILPHQNNEKIFNLQTKFLLIFGKPSNLGLKIPKRALFGSVTSLWTTLSVCRSACPQNCPNFR